MNGEHSMAEHSGSRLSGNGRMGAPVGVYGSMIVLLSTVIANVTRRFSSNGLR